MSGLEGILLHYFEQFTYLGILLVLLLCGIGVPIPEDVVLIVSGYLVYMGYTRLSLTIPICLLGVVMGDFIIYSIGKRWGEKIITHRFFSRILTRERINQGKAYFAKYGTKAVFIARHLAGLRFPIYFVAGMVKMPSYKFVLIDLSTALVTVPLIISLSYYFGSRIDWFVKVLKETEHILLILMLIVLFIFILTRRRNGRGIEDRR